VQYVYDELGRLKGVTTGDGVHTEKTYTTQGWLDRLHTTDATSAEVFSQELQYCQSGLISGVTSRQGSSSALSFGIAYDLAGRMTDWQQTGTNAFAEKDITYDANGNILTMRRYGADASLESDYSYAYSGNRLTGLTDGYLSTSSFGYDANGNLVSDSRSGITSVTYNALNLPQEMNGGEVKYVYLADGTKLAAVKDGSGLVYCGSMVYSGTFSESSTSVEVESTEFSAGRMVKKDGSVSPEYHVNDYLCSVRVVTDADGEVLERNDYSGFGKRLTSSAGSANRYRFSGKEEQAFAGLAWQDFGARMYDPDLARWTAPDPLAEKYPGISPYVYCNDNPVNIVDTDGEAIGFVMDVISVGCGVYNLVNNLKSGNTKAAWGDVAGIGLDLVCAVIPGVTINAGTAKTLAKSSLEIADRVVDAKGAWSLNPFDRGKSIEATLKGWGTNFPVIDKFDKTSRTITSIKSLDLNAKSYQSGNAVYNRGKGYIDKLAGFQRGELQEIIIESGDFDNRVLELAIPEGATSSQLEQLKKLKEYAQEQSIQLTIVLAK
jgi:RHS repeat-associated protein